MKRVFAIALTLSLLLSLCACIPTVPVVESPAATNSPEVMTPFLEDYDTFWRIVEENFPLYAAAERITGEDFQQVKEDFRPLAAGAKTAGDLEFYLAKCAEKFQGTGHFRLFNKGFYAYVMNLFKNSGDPKSKYEFDMLNNPNSRGFYSYTETQNAESGGGAQAIEQTTSASGNLIFLDYPEDGAAYVEILQMDIAGLEQDKKDLNAFFTRLEAEGYTDCIVDIRRNGGGDSSYGLETIVYPNFSEGISSTHYALVRGGQEALDYFDVVKGTWPLHPIADLPVEELPALNAEDLALATHYLTLDVRLERSEKEGKTPPLFTGGFWLLTSEAVYSASEFFAIFCKDTGFATLVGTETGGDGVGLNPYMHALPNTGICFEFSAENGLNLDGSGNEEFGTAPDIAIGAGEDALEVCLAMIKEGESK